jgi:elongation factor Ts
MASLVDEIRQLREETSCGVIDCKKALEESKGDFQKAKEILRKRGLEMAAKKAGRIATEGRVETYIHTGSKIGVMVEVNCETDFVARNDDFIKFSRDLAMHIAALAPMYIRKEDIPEDILDKETFAKEHCLLCQKYVKDQSKTITDYLNELISKIGENIQIRRFTRFKIGEA